MWKSVVQLVEATQIADRFAGRTAVITGGAKGIGRATALRFLKEGGDAIVVDLEDSASNWVESLRDEAAKLPGGLIYRRCNVADEAEICSTISDLLQSKRRIDVLVNNVGFSTLPAPLETVSCGAWDAAIEVNLTTVFLATRAILPRMRLQGGGSIVNLSSIAGVLTSDLANVSYHAAKAAILGLTRKLAHEEGQYGIRVNAVSPAGILTERIRPKYADLGETALANRMEIIPLRRSGEPWEVAAAILFLASDDAAYITGIDLPVTGGRHVQ